MRLRSFVAAFSSSIFIWAFVGACSSDSSEGPAGDSSGGSGGGSQPAPKEFSECCGDDLECESGVCSPDQHVCTVTCSADDECPAEPKSGKPDCKTSIGVCQAERADEDCEGDGTGGASGGGGATSGGASGAGGAASGGTTGSGGSVGTGGRAASPNVVTCAKKQVKDPWNGTRDSLICSCEGDGNTGATSYRGDACGQTDTDLFCCDGGTTDTCSCYQKRTWQCSGIPSGDYPFCECWYYGHITSWASRTPTTTCSVATKSFATRCYVWDANGHERCQCDARPLPAGARAVSSCDTADEAGVDDIVLSCPSGTTSVSTCSTGLYQEPMGGGCGSGCSGSQCVGDGLCCFYSCQGDKCAQNCNF